MSESSTELSRLLRVAGRALARADLVHAYGHCSARLATDRFLVTPSLPLGLIQPGQRCPEVRLDEPLPEGVLPEVRIHREIYRCRPDVQAVARTMPPQLMVLAAHRVTPVPRHGLGSYFHPAPAWWDDVQLVRSDAGAAAVAAALGGARAIVLRGNGAVVAAGSIEEAVVLTWYLEDMARIDLAGRAAGLAPAPPLGADEARARAVWSGAIRERMWDYLTAGDCESGA